MPGNGKVFISHASQDIPRCQPLLELLRSWEVDFWFDVQQMSAGEDLTQRIQDAMRVRDVFIRICTPAAQKSYWVRLEAGAFRGLEAASAPGQRTFINLILDAEYQPEPFDHAAIVIDAARQPQEKWQRELRKALGLPEIKTARPPKPPKDRTRTLSAAPKQGAVAALAAVVLLIAVAGVAFASHGAPFAFLSPPKPTATATATTAPPTATPTATPVLPAKLSDTVTKGPLNLFTMRFPADWDVQAPQDLQQSYGMDAGGVNVSMDFTVAFPDEHAYWTDDEWVSFDLENFQHTAPVKGSLGIGGITWNSYTTIIQQGQDRIREMILIARHAGHTFVITVQGRNEDFDIDNTMYFAPALATFTFTS